MTKAVWIAASLITPLLSATCGAAEPAGRSCAPPPRNDPGQPTFCGIPAKPKDVRTPAAFKAAVVDTRQAGLRLKRESAANTFGLPAGEAEAFARSAQADAAPPPIVAPTTAETEGFASEARRQVNAPPKPRRPLP